MVSIGLKWETYLRSKRPKTRVLWSHGLFPSKMWTKIVTSLTVFTIPQTHATTVAYYEDYRGNTVRFK